MKRILIAAALAATAHLFAACGSAESVWTGPLGTQGQPVQVPSSWTSVDSQCKFTFRAPADMNKQEVQGTDSCVGLYKNATIDLSYDYGWYSDSLEYSSTKPEYTETKVLVDGQSGKLISYRKEAGYIVAIHFPSLTREDRLTASAACKDAAAADTARLILSTIDFK